MLSPVKVLTGAALAALVSVSFLASRPFDAGPGSTQNAAELDPSLAAFATGTIIESTSPIDSNGTVVPGTGLVRTEGIHYTNRWETDDPRLTGIATYDAEWFRFPQSDFQVEAATHVLENADGRWVGQGTALAKWDSTNTDIAIMHGEGAYDGLTAYVLMDWTVQPPAITAAIFPGVMPRSPEPLSE